MKCIYGFGLGVMTALLSANVVAASFETVTIVTGSEANAYEQRYAKLLQDRLERKSSVDVLVQETPRQMGLTVYLGVAQRHPLLRQVCEEGGVRLPAPLDPGVEGFVLQSLSDDVLVAIGSDSRGVLYAVGEILRQAVGRENHVEFPTDLEMRDAPRFRYRGTLAWQGHTITELTGSRKWTDQEVCENILNYALAGANTFELWYGQVGPLYQLLRDYGLMTLTDMTHWVYSQYGLLDHELIPDRDYQLPPKWDFWMYARRPDPNLAMVYDRRTFHARPRNYHRAFQETMRYAIGECAYSEGHHDHFNQWMAQRLMWHPQQSVEEVVMEYARVHFGPEVAPLMAKAIFQHELNLETPIEDNPGIDGIIDILKKAGDSMPPALMQRDYLWRQYMQKAFLDKYIQLDARRQRQAVIVAENKLKAALGGDNSGAALAEAIQILSNQPGTDAMARLKAAAKQLGEESNRIHGVRSEGFFNLDQDYVGRGWIRRKAEEAARQQGNTQRESVRQIVYYEDAGEGGFYDDAGNPENSPHLVYGWPFGDGGFSGFNKLSQRTVAFTTDEKKGVAFAYPELDPNAQYRVRFTLVRPKYLPRFGIRQTQTKESIYADGFPLVEALELPEYESEFFEYDIPKEATRDGKLSIWFEKEIGRGEGIQSDGTLWRNTGGWGTLVSEVWLMKASKDY